MPTYNHLVSVARRLKRKANGHAFLTIPRREITEMLREVSEEETTRIKAGLSEQLERALFEQGLRAFPRIQDTSTDDTIRLFHPGTVVADLVDVLIHPDASTDKELAEITNKLKGRWDWDRQ